MKKLLLIFALFPCIAKAQMDTVITIVDRSAQRSEQNAYHLKGAKNLLWTGLAFNAVGLIVTGIGIDRMETAYDNGVNGTHFVGSDPETPIQQAKYFTLIGVGIGLVGVIIDIAAIHHIGKLKLTGNGVAVNL